MNRFYAHVVSIKGIENLHLVTLAFDKIELTMLSLELPEGVVEGRRVALSVKPSSVILAKDLTGHSSVSNTFKAKVSKITRGTLVSMVESQVAGATLQSLLTSKSIDRLSLKPQDSVTLLIQASALSIIEVCDD